MKLLPLVPASAVNFRHCVKPRKVHNGDNYNDPAMLDGYLTLLGNDFRAKTMCLQHISQKFLPS